MKVMPNVKRICSVCGKQIERGECFRGVETIDSEGHVVLITSHEICLHSTAVESFGVSSPTTTTTSDTPTSTWRILPSNGTVAWVPVANKVSKFTK